MKVNLIAVAMAFAVALATVGCCSSGCGSCGKSNECSGKQCGIGMNANVGAASAGAGINSSGVHVEAKTGK